jgi:hypothetical protein
MAASRLEAINVEQIPESIQKRVTLLWEDRVEFVKGVQELVEGFQGMQVVLTNLQKQMESYEARILTLETQLAVMRGRMPPPPPPHLDEICLEEDTLGESKPS